MDMYPFNRYGIDDKNITAEFVEVKDYKPFISKRPTIKKIKVIILKKLIIKYLI